jgi:hypothetical protein
MRIEVSRLSWRLLRLKREVLRCRLRISWGSVSERRSNNSSWITLKRLLNLVPWLRYPHQRRRPRTYFPLSSSRQLCRSTTSTYNKPNLRRGRLTYQSLRINRVRDQIRQASQPNRVCPRVNWVRARQAHRVWTAPRTNSFITRQPHRVWTKINWVNS